ELALAVRLPAGDVQLQLCRPLEDAGLELTDAEAAVELRVSPADDVEVDSIENGDAHGGTLVGDQPVERLANIRLRHARREASVAPEQDEPQLTAGGLLVAFQRLPRALAVDLDRCRPQNVLDRIRRPPGEPQGRQQPERDCAAVRDGLIAGAGLERVGEGVAQVENQPRAEVVRIAQAERGLEGRTTANELPLWKLPQRLAGHHARLDALREPFAALLFGQRLQQPGIDQRAYGPVEGPDQVCPLW